MSFDDKSKLVTCKHCNKQTDAEDSSYVQKLIVHYKTQKQVIKDLSKK